MADDLQKMVENLASMQVEESMSTFNAMKGLKVGAAEADAFFPQRQKWYWSHLMQL